MHNFICRPSRSGSPVLVLLTAVLVSLGTTSHAGTNNIVGSYANWPITWIPISSLNDPDDGLTAGQLELVGDTSNPTVQYALTPNYICFRLQVQYAGVVVPPGSPNPTFNDTHMIMVDLANYTNPLTTSNRPDYAFAWDSQATPITKHGLEMMVPSTIGNTWDALRFADIDGQNGDKIAPPDFGAGTTDGFVRTIDGQATANFGTVTYVDYAISRSYLSNNVPAMITNSVWRIQIGTIANKNDHNAISADVAGGAGVGSTIDTTWSAPITIPEPSTAALVGLGLLVMTGTRRGRRQ